MSTEDLSRLSSSRAPGDVSAHFRLTTLIEAQKRYLEMLYENAPLSAMLAELTHAIEVQAEGTAVAAILLLGEDGRLRHGVAPSLPEEYRQAIEGIRADPQVGTCAAAAATGEIVITPDIAAAPSWSAFSHLPLALGLVAAWSMPIKSRDDTVLGTFGTYFRQRRQPFPDELESVGILARTAAHAIENAKVR